jgi:hypothetical protein
MIALCDEWLVIGGGRQTHVRRHSMPTQTERRLDEKQLQFLRMLPLADCRIERESRSLSCSVSHPVCV